MSDQSKFVTAHLCKKGPIKELELFYNSDLSKNLSTSIYRIIMMTWHVLGYRFVNTTGTEEPIIVKRFNPI